MEHRATAGAHEAGRLALWRETHHDRSPTRRPAIQPRPETTRQFHPNVDERKARTLTGAYSDRSRRRHAAAVHLRILWRSICVSWGGFFCPACGHNSAPSIFDRTLEIVRTTLNALTSISETLAAAHDEDAARDSVRQILEDQFSRLVGAFESLSEALFDQLPNRPQFKVRRGTFQRLDEASDLWRQAAGSGYSDILEPSDYRDLKRLFEQRHVLGHRQGIVDDRYLRESGDTTYAVGQRLIIREPTVLRLADLVEALAADLRKLV